MQTVKKKSRFDKPINVFNSLVFHHNFYVNVYIFTIVVSQMKISIRQKELVNASKDLYVFSSLSLTDCYKSGQKIHKAGDKETFHSLCFPPLRLVKQKKLPYILLGECVLPSEVFHYGGMNEQKMIIRKTKIFKFIESYTSHQPRLKFASFKRKDSLRIWTDNQFHPISESM